MKAELIKKVDDKNKKLRVYLSQTTKDTYGIWTYSIFGNGYDLTLRATNGDIVEDIKLSNIFPDYTEFYCDDTCSYDDNISDIIEKVYEWIKDQNAA